MRVTLATVKVTVELELFKVRRLPWDVLNGILPRPEFEPELAEPV